MSGAGEFPGRGFPHLGVVWPGRPLLAGITVRAASALSDGCADPALESLRAFAAERFDELVSATQVHGSRIYEAYPAKEPERPHGEAPSLLRLTGYDGFFSRRPGTLLTVAVADCVPALLYAPDAGAVALLHAGWRGIAAGILAAALDRMEAAGIRPEALSAWWGPAVGPCCYQVGEEVVEALQATEAGRTAESWVRSSPEGARVDLREALSRQAEARGMRPSSIRVSPYCTSCTPELFFSHRREPSAGRMLAFAGLPRGNGAAGLAGGGLAEDGLAWAEP